MEPVSGIYSITHIISGRCYIGSAINIHSRWKKHRRELDRGIHKNAKLQRVWTKYGSLAFQFAVLEFVEVPENLIEQEQYYFDTLNPFYNIVPTAGSMLGYRHTPEARALFRQRMQGSQIRKGKPHSPETRARFSTQRKGQGKGRKGNQAMLGKKHTEETRSKISEARKRQPLPTEETRAKLRASHLGKKHSLETRAKLSKYSEGITLSKETRAKISEAKQGNNAALGRKHTEYSKQKMSKKLKGNTRRLGQKQSEETRAKIAASVAASHARRKETTPNSSPVQENQGVDE